jgi:hypothetical protein
VTRGPLESLLPFIAQEADMALITGTFEAARSHFRLFGGLLAVTALAVAPAAYGQDRDRDYDRGRDYDRVARVDPGTTIPVRVNQSIDADKGDNRVYQGTVDQDVRGENGRIVIPRGSQVEMMVRYARDNDLNLDLDSVIVNGQRYGVRSSQKHIESQRDNSLVGSIVGAINGGQAHGRAVRIPRDAVVTFRLAQSLEVGAAPREDRDRDYRDRDRDRDR